MIQYFSSEDHLISSQKDTQMNMQLFIYFFIALVALSSAKQLQNRPQILYEKPSYSAPTQKMNKRAVTPEFNLYFTPEEVQALQAVKSPQNSASIETLNQNSGISEGSYNKLIQKYYAANLKPAPIEEPQVEPARSMSNFFLPREESVYNSKPNYRQLLMDQTKLSGYAQNAQKNKFNQVANPSITDLPLFKPASSFNKNEDQRKSEKEIEYILRNVPTDQSRQLNSPYLFRTQNFGENVGQTNSKENENALIFNQAFNFERLNSPVDTSKQSLSASKENQEMIEEQKRIEYILRNDQAYGFERTNAFTEVNNQPSQSINELREKSEVQREIEHFWSKQQDSQFQRSLFPDKVFNPSLSGWNENKGKPVVDKNTENIFRPKTFGLHSPFDVSNQSPLGRNENQDKTEAEKQIELFFRNRQAEYERKNAPGVNGESQLVTDQNKSDVEKQIQQILKKHQDLEFQRSKSVAEAINQSPPIKIHEHVTITKHLPVPVLNTVQVSVPTPVLVPIPQPYEVKVPHLYPVPLKVVKHVPVPLVTHF